MVSRIESTAMPISQKKRTFNKFRMRDNCGWLSLSHDNGEKLQEGDSMIGRRLGDLPNFPSPGLSIRAPAPHGNKCSHWDGRCHHLSARAENTTSTTSQLQPCSPASVVFCFAICGRRHGLWRLCRSSSLLPAFDNHGINAILVHITSPRPPSVPPSLRRASAGSGNKQSADIMLTAKTSTLPPEAREENEGFNVFNKQLRPVWPISNEI